VAVTDRIACSSGVRAALLRPGHPLHERPPAESTPSAAAPTKEPLVRTATGTSSPIPTWPWRSATAPATAVTLRSGPA